MFKNKSPNHLEGLTRKRKANRNQSSSSEEVSGGEPSEEEEAFMNGQLTKKVNWSRLGSSVYMLFRRVVGIDTMFGCLCFKF
jgi:hypothetical protein